MYKIYIYIYIIYYIYIYIYHKLYIENIYILYLLILNQLLLIAASMKEFHSIALYRCNSMDSNLIFCIILSILIVSAKETSDYGIPNKVFSIIL